MQCNGRDGARHLHQHQDNACCLHRVRVLCFLKDARMGYVGLEEKILQDRAGMGQEALKTLSSARADE